MAESEEFWDRKRKSPFRWITTTIHLGLICAGIFAVLLSGPRPRSLNFFVSWQLLCVIGFVVVTAIHELGHTLVAWGLGFRFVAINIGPLTIKRDQWGHRHVRIDWNRLTHNGGYAAAVPTTEEHLRSNAMLVVFAGPFASLNAGLLCWLLYRNLPGSSWEAYWVVPGILAVLFVADFIANLIPIGYCDGSMLLHLLLWTKHGQDLYALHLASKTHHDASQRLVEKNFAEEVQLRRKALDQMLARGDAPSRALGHSYQALAYAQMNHSQRQDAEINLQKSLEVFADCRGIDAIYEANSWRGLEKIYRIRGKADEAQRAVDLALGAYEKVRAGNLERASAAEIGSIIADLHADQRHYELGLREVRLALDLLPDGTAYLVQTADLLRVMVRCEAGLGNLEQARAVTFEAANLLRSPKVPETERNRAASAIGNLAATAWLAGVGDTSVELLRESIQKLETKGSSIRAMGPRIVLASILRREEKWADAEAALPAESEIEPERREVLFEERARIFVETRRVAQAVADAREALKLVEQKSGDNAVEVASAQANLAEFLLADGSVDEAEQFARCACDELLPRRHTDAAGALVTLALLRDDESSAAMVEEAKALVRDAPLMESGSKTWALKGLERRLKSQEFFDSHEILTPLA